MANALYDRYKEAIMLSQTNSNIATGVTATNPYVSLVSAITAGTPSEIYTFNAADQFYSSVASAERTTPGEITPPAVSTAGVFSQGGAGTVVFASVATSVNKISALVIFIKNAGANTTWRNVLYEDTSITGLPITPNNGGITVQWNGSGIFKL